MAKNNIEVSPHGDGWQVKKQGSQRASKVFDTQKDAISYGRPKAKEDKVEFIIKNRKGQIREKDSYGNDPFPPRG
jgi:hypothetical protein